MYENTLDCILRGCLLYTQVYTHTHKIHWNHDFKWGLSKLWPYKLKPNLTDCSFSPNMCHFLVKIFATLLRKDYDPMQYLGHCIGSNSPISSHHFFFLLLFSFLTFTFYFSKFFSQLFWINSWDWKFLFITINLNHS